MRQYRHDVVGMQSDGGLTVCYQQPDEALSRGALDNRGDADGGSNRQDNRQEAQS